jgi:hypothetical protein
VAKLSAAPALSDVAEASTIVETTTIDAGGVVIHYLPA